jgi:hypothetical protein
MKYITTRNNTHRLYKQHIFVCTAADEIRKISNTILNSLDSVEENPIGY